MKSLLLHEGTGRTRISLSNHSIGNDLIVCLFNECGHIGAVAVAEFCREENRASTSVITRYGHKEDAVASRAAHQLCKALKKPICAIVGIHLDNITDEEIAQITQNCDTLVETFCKQWLVVSS